MLFEEFKKITNILVDILKQEKIIIIGSQSIYGQLKQIGETIEIARISREVDVIINNQELNNKIFSFFGELSSFDNKNHIYIDPVFEKEIALPKHYKNRLVNFQEDRIQLLNIHDYIACKAYTHREKDIQFLEEFKNNLVNFSIIIDFDRILNILNEFPKENIENIEYAKKLIKKIFLINKIEKNDEQAIKKPNIKTNLKKRN
jgi:hypothetical protein